MARQKSLTREQRRARRKCQERATAGAGELAVHDGVVPCAEARRWLSARGVPGVVTQAT